MALATRLILVNVAPDEPAEGSRARNRRWKCKEGDKIEKDDLVIVLA